MLPAHYRAVCAREVVRDLGATIQTEPQTQEKILAAKMISGTECIYVKLAATYFDVRTLAILMTQETMVAISLLQVVVTWISDDELQIWCKKCVFGTAPFNRSLTDQNKALEGAIKDIT